MKQDFLKNGRNALTVGAWEEAKALLQSAVQAGATAEALEELAWAHWWLSEMSDVFELRTKAHNLFLKNHDKRGASRTASWLGLDYLEFSGEFAIANGWFQRAENLLEGIEDCKELSLIKTLKANLCFRVEKNVPGALQLIDETIELSKSIDDTESLMLAEALKGFILVTIGQIREGMQLLDEATVLALGEQSVDIHKITTTCCFLIDACQRTRDYERAGQWCNKVKEICKRWRHRAVFATCRTQYASVLIWQGEWQEAEAELALAMKELKQFKPASINGCTIRMADLRRRQGRWTEALELFDTIKSHGGKAISRAELAFDQEEYPLALDLIDKFLRQVPANEMTERVAGLELLLRSHVQLGQLDDAQKCLEELETIAAMMATIPFQAAMLSAKGILNFALQQFDLSRKNLEDAVDLYEELPSPFEASRARVALADAFEKLNQFSSAEVELNKAIKVFKALGAKHDLDKTRQRLKDVGKGDSGAHGFTRRELAVLKLVAAGKNNEEISESLFLSVRTVEKHLSNVYQKLGVSGKSARTFAATYLSKKMRTP